MHDNRAGAETCENCLHELTPRSPTIPKAEPPPGLGSEPLSALNPKAPVFVALDASVAQAVDTMNQLNIGCVLVGNQNNVAGIFTERDLLFNIGATYDEARDRPIADFMRPNPEMLDADTPLAQALGRMSEGGFRYVPITRGGRLVGVVSLRDLLGLVRKWYPDLLG
jgi:CBS domain-containing protein